MGVISCRRGPSPGAARAWFSTESGPSELLGGEVRPTGAALRWPGARRAERWPRGQSQTTKPATRRRGRTAGLAGARAPGDARRWRGPGPQGPASPQRQRQRQRGQRGQGGPRGRPGPGADAGPALVIARARGSTAGEPGGTEASGASDPGGVLAGASARHRRRTDARASSGAWGARAARTSSMRWGRWVGVLAQAAQDDLVDGRRDGRVEPAQRGRFGREHGGDQAGEGVAVEGGLAREGLVGDAAKGPDVRADIDGRGALELLGRGVAR